jgi:hypothetical protein
MATIAKLASAEHYPNTSDYRARVEREGPARDGGLLNDIETQRLIRSLLEVRGTDGASEAEILDFLKWANGMKAFGIMFGLIIDGEIVADWDPSISDAVLALPGTPRRGGRP